jgi:hypothetical protein
VVTIAGQCVIKKKEKKKEKKKGEQGREISIG